MDTNNLNKRHSVNSIFAWSENVNLKAIHLRTNLVRDIPVRRLLFGNFQEEGISLHGAELYKIKRDVSDHFSTGYPCLGP